MPSGRRHASPFRLVSRAQGNLAFRLAAAYGTLIVVAMVAMAGVVYLGTVGVIESRVDTTLRTSSGQLLRAFNVGGIAGLRREIETELNDNVDQDTEVFLLVGPSGSLIGNIAAVSTPLPLDRFVDVPVSRYGVSSRSRLLAHSLGNGYILVVGRDLAPQIQIQALILRSMLIGGAIALLLAVAGAILFRRQLEAQIATIRRTAEEIEAGDLGRRIPEDVGLDEFAKLNRSINRMLERIQSLMDGVRDVSNAIAHDLRTPLGRIRSLLDDAVSRPLSAALLAERARDAINGIDDLTAVFDKLLQIAEAETGARRQSFQPLLLSDILLPIVELYDAVAEAKGIALVAAIPPRAAIFGDRQLLASAAANLIDNAVKYGEPGTTVTVRAEDERDTSSIVIEDDGPGIPESERAKVLTRFYRLDRSRSIPGNGLGLTIVNAISHLHDGSLSLEDAGPGLRVRIVLPRYEPPSIPARDMAVISD
jgi:signal transduction histidine kinase